MTIVLIITIVFFAAFIQSLSGFGFAVIIMPLLSLMVGLQVAAPTVALTALTVYSINIVRYRRAIDYKELVRLGIAAALGVPLGMWVLTNMDESVVMRIMGVMLVSYAVYALVRPTTKWVLSRYWAYPAGFMAGCLSGAYNVPGPPVIVYGSLRQWPKDEFRAVLQAIFFIGGVLVVGAHLVAHRVTVEVLTFYAFALPALGMGILVGSRVDRHVDRERFRKIVTVMILLLGLTLLFGIG
ncbi:MAG: sulfite exporter TauE/SafE family protein [Anaerolineae bacterium]|jgi:hypothetical protein